MPLVQDKPLQALFDQGPMLAACRRTTERVGEAITDGAARRTPVADPPAGVGASAFAGRRGRAPGTLKASWYATSVDFKAFGPLGVPRFTIDSQTDDPIAPHVEWPTRPHLIRPRKDRPAASVAATGKPRRSGGDPQAALAWIGPGGTIHFAHEVHHPGTQGAHMMRDSLAEAEATWQSIGEEEMQRWAREQAELSR